MRQKFGNRDAPKLKMCRFPILFQFSFSVGMGRVALHPSDGRSVIISSKQGSYTSNAPIGTLKFGNRDAPKLKMCRFPILFQFSFSVGMGRVALHPSDGRSVIISSKQGSYTSNAPIGTLRCGQRGGTTGAMPAPGQLE